MKPRSPLLGRRTAYRILRHFSGGIRSSVAIIVLLTLLVTFTWFADGAFQLAAWGLAAVGGGGTGATYTLSDLGLSLVSFPLLLLIIYGLSLWAQEEVSVRARSDADPEPVQALVLFLSGMDEASLEWAREAASEGHCPADLEMGWGFKWRMPLVAIRHHEPRLRKVVVIGSRDSAEDSPDGSVRQIPDFAHFVQGVVRSDIRVCGPEDFKSHQAKGVDFGQIQSLVDEVEAAIRYCRERGIPEDDILVDITGGTKMATIAGAMSALGQDRQCQYVSADGSEAHVRTYDITYQPVEGVEG